MEGSENGHGLLPPLMTREAQRMLAPLRWRFAIAGIALAGVAIAAAAVSRLHNEQDRWTGRSREVGRLARSARALAGDRETAVRGFLLTGDQRFLALDIAAREPLRHILDSVVALTADDAGQHARALRIREAVGRWDREHATPAVTGGGAAAVAATLEANGRPLYAAVRAALAAFTDGTESLYRQREAAAARFAWLGLLALTTAIAAVGMFLWLFWRQFVRQTMSLLAQRTEIEGQAHDLEEQAVELEEQAAELEMANEELKYSLVTADATRTLLENMAREQKSLIRAMRDVVIVFDRNGVYRRILETSREPLSRPASTFLGRRLGDVLPSDAASALLTAIHEALATERPRQVEFRVPGGGADGGTRWFDALVTPLGGDEALCVSREVTDRQLSREELRTTAATLRAVIESSPVAIITTDLEHGLMEWNRAAVRLFGDRDADGDPRSRRLVPPERRAESHRLREAALRGVETTGFETERQRRDGVLVPVSMSVAPLRSPDGIVCGFVYLYVDLTERNVSRAARRASEESFRRLVEYSPDGILVHAGGTVVFANPAIARILGEASASDLLGRQAMSLVAPEFHDFVSRRIDALASGQSVPLAPERLLRADGSGIDVEVVGIPFTYDGRAAVQVVVRDISDRRRLEMQLRQAQKMESVGLLAGGVAHDFNNMLSAIRGYSELVLMDEALADEHRSDVTEITKAADRAAALTRQLLAFSRQQVLQPRVVEVNATIGDIESMLRRLMVGDVTITTALSPTAGFVEVDPSQLEQVLLNLAVNARDAMPDGGCITITTARAELDDAAAAQLEARPGSYVLLTVTDTGCGMDAATRDRIFDPFFTTKPTGGGTGLGLSTVYGIVKQSGGHICVYSEPGHGTTFKVYLPYVHEHRLREPPAVAAPPAATATETILLVEDEPLVRGPLKKFLELRGYTVLEAMHGAAALEVSADFGERIDLLITDLMMPEVGGHELATRLLETRPAVKVLFTSGYTNDHAARRGLVALGSAFLQKPFTLAALATTVRDVLDGTASR